MSSSNSVSFFPLKVHTELYLNSLKGSSKVAMIVEVFCIPLWHEVAISFVGDTYYSFLFFNRGNLIWCLKIGLKIYLVF